MTPTFGPELILPLIPFVFRDRKLVSFGDGDFRLMNLVQVRPWFDGNVAFAEIAASFSVNASR